MWRNMNCTVFASLCPEILKNTFTRSQPIRRKRNTSRDFIADVFPRFRKIACFDFGLSLVSCNLFLLFWWAFVTTYVWIYGTRSKYSLKWRGLWLFISMLKYRKISYPSWNLKVDIWLILNMPQNFRSNNIQDSQGKKKLMNHILFIRSGLIAVSLVLM